MDPVEQLLDLRQRSLPIEEYVAQFCELSYRVPFDEVVLKNIFRFGLNEPIKSWLPEGKFNCSLKDFIDYALLALCLLWVSRRRIATPRLWLKWGTHQNPLTKWWPQPRPVMSQLPFLSQVKSQLIVMSPVKSQLIIMNQVKSPLIFMSPVKSPLIFMSPVKSPLIFMSPVKSPLIFMNQVTAALHESRHLSADRLEQGSPNLILEDLCPAEFSSNLPQHTSLEVSSIPSKTLISCFRCVWLGLEINSAGHRPSRTVSGDPWSRVTSHLSWSSRVTSRVTSHNSWCSHDMIITWKLVLCSAVAGKSESCHCRHGQDWSRWVNTAVTQS